MEQDEGGEGHHQRQDVEADEAAGLVLLVDEREPRQQRLLDLPDIVDEPPFIMGKRHAGLREICMQPANAVEHGPCCGGYRH